MKKTLTGSTAIIATSPLFANNGWGPLSTNSPKISLAQWSLHRAFEKGMLKAEDFAAIAADSYNIQAIEYVNAFYKDFAEDQKFWNSMKTRARDAGVKSLLIMVDNEGDLGDPNKQKRRDAVQNHYKWIEAAKLLNCHSIRVNAFGSGERKTLKPNLIEGLGELANYGARLNINVLIENHGLHTSDAVFVTEIINTVDNEYLGTLPDFGNWCLSAEWGSTQGGSCTEIYDPYKGVGQMLPFAKGVSAKSYDFDEDGNETTIDYQKMLRLVKSSKFDGYVGIEYEGRKLSEEAGIRATKNLIEKIWKEV
ncbi:MAG: sugar phosphate isomerase/epimerase family protein [Flavobacteriaceae bacterium]